MTTERLNIELQDGLVLQAISHAIAQLEDTSALMQSIGAKLESNIELRFDTKTDPSGQPWAPLSPTTIAIYESDWFIEKNPAFDGGIPGSLLERTRALRNSLSHNASAGLVEIGTNRETANRAWQVGMLMEWGTNNMPRRGILTADPQSGTLGAGDEADVLAIVGNYLGAVFG